jgi:hypothetical protein
MLMHTPINPPPPIRCRIPRIRHVRARIEAPSRVRCSAYRLSVAEDGPDGLRAGGVAWMMLLIES